MSIVRSYRDQFTIYIYDKDMKRCSGLSEVLSFVGYKYAQFFSPETLEEGLENQLPHMLILFYQPLSVEFRKVLKRTRELSPETEIVVLGSGDFWPGIKNLMDTQLIDDFWAWPFANRDFLRLRVDQFIEKTIYKYLGEQKSEKIAGIVKRMDELKDVSNVKIEKFSETSEAFKVAKNTASESELIEELLANLKSESPNAEFAYLKFYGPKEQILVYKTSFSAETYTRGQFFTYSTEDREKDRRENYKRIQETVGELFVSESYNVFPVEFSDTTFGFLVGFNVTVNSVGIVEKAARYTSLILRNMELEKSQSDPVPAAQFEKVLDSRHFYEVLSKEVSRGRRIESPVSVLLGHIRYRGHQEEAIAVALDKIKDCVRVYDVVSPLSEFEIAIILPHCDAKAAAIKAERLRRTLVADAIESQNSAVRLCFGVAEFPGLSTGSDDLLENAKAACDQVLASGKNKVCLYTQTEDFEPEFHVQ